MRDRFRRCLAVAALGLVGLLAADPARAFQLETVQQGAVDLPGLTGRIEYQGNQLRVTLQEGAALLLPWDTRVLARPAIGTGGGLVFTDWRGREVHRRAAGLQLVRQSDDLLSALSGFRLTPRMPRDQVDIVNMLARIGLPLNTSALAARLKGPGGRAMAEAVARGRVYLLESRDAYAVVMADAQMGAPRLMLPVRREQPLWLAPGGAQTPALGAVINGDPLVPAQAPARNGLRLVCAPMDGCGWVSVSDLYEVAPVWILVAKSDGRILDFRGN